MSGEKKMAQESNTIIMEFSSASDDDLKDLRQGEGKLFRRIAKAIEQLKATGEIGENVQPVIAVVKKKKKERGILG